MGMGMCQRVKGDATKMVHENVDMIVVVMWGFVECVTSLNHWVV